MIRDPNNPTHSAFPSPFIPSLFGTRNGIQGFAFARLLSPWSSSCSLQTPLQGCGSSFSLPIPEKWCLWAASPNSQSHVSPCLRASVPISQSSFPCAQRGLLSVIGFRFPPDFLLFLRCSFPGLSYSLMSSLLWIQCYLLAFMLILFAVIWGLCI